MDIVACPYCRQDIKKWEYNSEKAAQIQELHPEICKEKFVEEKNQKLLKKPYIMRVLVREWYNSITETSALHIPLMDAIISFVILALFWIFSIPLVYLKYFIIHIGLFMLFISGTMGFLAESWDDFMLNFVKLLLDDYVWHFSLVLQYCVLNYLLCIYCVNDTYKAMGHWFGNLCLLTVFSIISWFRRNYLRF